ncbi:MAG: FAD-dependent oxidoreductase [Clostridia bacterium]|nr:FAD-dependent oxidoreductase [Clostridia bacterium]
MILVNNIKLPLDTDFNNFKSALKKHSALKGVIITDAKLYKRSVDARRKDDLHFCCSALISVSGGENKALKRLKNSKIYLEEKYEFKTVENHSGERPVVVGFGPAGIFAAYTLAKAGLKPIVLERGKAVDQRTEDVKSFWEGKELNTESNVQFGEGGAGTFSDGKLTTGINDRRCRTVLEIFHENGANENILTEAKAHIGTDVLALVIKNIREKIISLGGEIRFSSRLDKINSKDGAVCSVEVSTRESRYTLPCDRLILAIGHSARDTLYMLKDINIEMVRKPFAVGVRIEHKQNDINRALYGNFANHPALSAADYKLAVHLPSGRGVYTFCMCPGGFVVNASSENKRLAVNGMSYSLRDGENANSALLCEVLPDDLEGDDVLAGIEFQRKLEQAAYNLASGSGVPVQTVGSYLFGENTSPTVTPTVKPSAVYTDISEIFPDFINTSLRDGIKAFGIKISGFDSKGAVLTAPESRSSCPVRILRDSNFCSLSLNHLYPSGEGAGYAGGIMSAAVDGIKTAEAVIDSFL